MSNGAWPKSLLVSMILQVVDGDCAIVPSGNDEEATEFEQGFVLYMVELRENNGCTTVVGGITMALLLSIATQIAISTT